MARLSVFTTEGVCIYPEGGADDPGINRYFESINLVVDTRDAGAPRLEAYFRARLPDGRPEQLYLRYEGDDAATVFADCRRAVKRELVQGAGWHLVTTEDAGDPATLLQRAILSPADRPETALAEGPLRTRRDLLAAAVESGPSLSATGPNYRELADAVRALADVGGVFVVASDDLTIPEADLVLYPNPAAGAVGLTGASRDALAGFAQHRGAPAGGPTEGADLEEAMATIHATLASLEAADVDEWAVRHRLEETVADVYPHWSLERADRSPEAGDVPGLEPAAPTEPRGIRNRVLDGIGAVGAAIAAATSRLDRSLPGRLRPFHVALIVLLIAIPAVAFGVLPQVDDAPNGEGPPETFDLTGTVALAGDGPMPANATVGLEGSVDPAADLGSDGTFAFENLSAGTYTLATNVSGYVDAQRTVNLTDADRELSIELEPLTFAVEITAANVVDDGAAIAVEIVVVNEAAEFDRQRIAVSGDDVEGNATWVGLAGGANRTLTLRVPTTDAGPFEVTVTSTHAEDTLTLEPSSEPESVRQLSSRIVEPGETVTVALDVTTEADGAVRINETFTPPVSESAIEVDGIPAGVDVTVRNGSITIEAGDTTGFELTYTVTIPGDFERNSLTIRDAAEEVGLDASTIRVNDPDDDEPFAPADTDR